MTATVNDQHMANKIHIMTPELANKIAAGEVVQRPASVVKELVENAVDAHATRVTVIVKDAGKALIQVTDNGEGMSEADAAMAFNRHATSKVATAEDLENIRTLGFRGEALASIAAVAQVELRTRTEGEDLGSVIRIEGSEERERSKTAHERGSSVTVRNLFFNTPARRNFLKTRQTELKNISDVVTRMAIACPGVEWKLISDDEPLLDLKVKPIQERLAELFGRPLAESLLPLEESTEFMTVKGFAGRPDFSRKSRVEQFVFLNQRYIVSRMLNHAVFQAYEHLLQHGTFPFFILDLTTDPHHVDVNVHPSKLEVKFERESDVYRLVLSVVRKALASNNLVPTMAFQDGSAVSGEEGRFRFAVPGGDQTSRGPAPVIQLPPRPVGQQETAFVNFEELFEHREGDSGRDERARAVPLSGRILEGRSGDDAAASSSEGRPVWQVHNKYIVAQVRNGLMIVDQHVAHERILYERALANFENALPTTQQLLFPETVELTASDYALVKGLLPDLQRLGFDMKLFGKNTVVIDGIPADVRIGNEKEILQEFLDEYRTNDQDAKIDMRDKIAKSFACKAAIKAGDRLKTHEMVALIEHLFLTRMPYVCPHGRPVVVKIPLDELDRRFGRTS
jgi:DNA mismatch repair protein MutL